MSQIKTVRQEEPPLTHKRVSLFVLFRPSPDWMGPPHGGEQSALFSLQIPMLISSRNTPMATSRLVFDQTSGHLVAQLS